MQYQGKWVRGRNGTIELNMIEWFISEINKDATFKKLMTERGLISTHLSPAPWLMWDKPPFFHAIPREMGKRRNGTMELNSIKWFIRKAHKGTPSRKLSTTRGLVVFINSFISTQSLWDNLFFFFLCNTKKNEYKGEMTLRVEEDTIIYWYTLKCYNSQ